MTKDEQPARWPVPIRHSSFVLRWPSTATGTRVTPLLARIPAETLRRPGTIPRYGEGYSLEDLEVYQYYGHKREHRAQVDVFRDRLADPGIG